MLAVAFVVALVTGVVISSTEDKVRETYSQLAEERFEAQVNEFLEVRKTRLEDMGQNLDKVASSDWARKVFAVGDFSSKSLADFGKIAETLAARDRPSGPGRKVGGQVGDYNAKGKPFSGPGLLGGKRLLCLVDGEGGLHPLGGARFRKGKESQRALQELAGVGYVDERQMGYLVSESDQGESQVVEIVAVPVRAEEGSKPMGAVMIGMVVPLSISPAGRNEKKKIPSTGSENLLTGILVEGEVFSPGMSAGLKESVRLAAADSLELGEDRLQEELVLEYEGTPYRLFCERLNPGGTLPPAYEVVLYPLTQLRSELMDLRLKGSGVGVGALWFGVFMAWLLARRFSHPIRELAVATKEIREGNYEVSVPIRSKDEFGDLAKSFNEMAEELKTKEQIRDVLGKVADEAVAEALISGSLELGGETRTVSILFCDIRGFTTLSEAMEPTDVIALLNDHMTAMTRVVYDHCGVVDKFVGDEIMAVFGAPKTYGDDAENAALCALKMLEERARLNQGAEHPFEVGIGIATGSVVVGCIGSMDRLNYTVIGERVNRASRLSGLAEPRQAVVDEVTWQAIVGRAGGKEIENVNLKGYAGEVRAFLLERVEEADLTHSG